MVGATTKYLSRMMLVVWLLGPATASADDVNACQLIWCEDNDRCSAPVRDYSVMHSPECAAVNVYEGELLGANPVLRIPFTSGVTCPETLAGDGWLTMCEGPELPGGQRAPGADRAQFLGCLGASYEKYKQCCRATDTCVVEVTGPE